MNPQRIDVHHHFLPPELLAELKRSGRQVDRRPAGSRVESRHRARDDGAPRHRRRSRLRRCPASTGATRSSRCALARHANEFAARIVQDDPAHFGFFAAVPLPDTRGGAARSRVRARRAEARRRAAVSRASATSIPATRQFDELFQELERRKAIVHIHPSTVVPGAIVPKLSIPWGLVEFVLDTTPLQSRTCSAAARSSAIRRSATSSRTPAAPIPYIALRLAIRARWSCRIRHERTEGRAALPEEALLRHRVVDVGAGVRRAQGVRADRARCCSAATGRW